jgi:hypothetical protein
MEDTSILNDKAPPKPVTEPTLPSPADSTTISEPTTDPINSFSSWGWNALSALSTEATKITKQIESTASSTLDGVYKTLDPEYEKEAKLREEIDGAKQPAALADPDPSNQSERDTGDVKDQGDFVDTLDRTFSHLGSSISSGFSHLSKSGTQVSPYLSKY